MRRTRMDLGTPELRPFATPSPIHPLMMWPLTPATSPSKYKRLKTRDVDLRHHWRQSVTRHRLKRPEKVAEQNLDEIPF